MASENLLNTNEIIFTFLKRVHLPNTIIISKLENYLKTIKDKNCFVIASKTTYGQKKEELEKILSLENKYLLSGEPTELQLKECCEKLKLIPVSFILAIGGGSVLDLAKAVKKNMKKELIVVPTTPGTGSEVTSFSVFITERNEKKVINSLELLPDVVILDPSLLKTIPLESLRYFVIDMLSHSLESFSSKFANPMADSLALDAYQKVLRQVRRKSYDDEFYSEIQIAGLLAGIAQGSAYTGLAHSFAHYLGPRYNIPHGKALSYFLKEVVQLNLASQPTLIQKFERQGMTNEKLLRELQEIFSLLNIKEEKIAVENFNITEAAQKIRKDVCTLTNPILPTEEQIKAILEKKIEITPLKSKVDALLELNPYDIPQSEKEKLFLEAMKESHHRHYNNNELFKRFIDAQNSTQDSLETIPYLPITLFKEMELITGKKEDIKNIIRSSATTSNKPSIIALDELTVKRQQVALRKIMGSFLGEKRMVFIVFDSKSTVERNGLDLSSKASAVRGMTQFAKSMRFILNDNLEFDQELFNKALEGLTEQDEICFFGFTWLMYKTYLAMKEKNTDITIIEKLQTLKYNTKILHTGGWKKLTDLNVNKDTFVQNISTILNIEKGNVIDFYGMTEQLGTVYPDCEYGYKHMPLYSEIIIRNADTLQPANVGETGFIQLLTPIPHSYPGISILTEDLGEIVGIDTCQCGRKGKYFIFKKRVEKAPLKGCGDTL